MESEEEVEVEDTEDDSEYIVPPGAVVGKGGTAEEAVPTESPANQVEESETKDEEASVETPAEKPAEAAAPEDDTVVINGKTYSKQEVEDIFSTGQSIHEYKKEHPGFDPMLIERDYRIKTARLAELEKGVKPEAEETPDLSDLDPNDVARLEKWAKSKGLVSREDMARQDYERQKQASVDAFLSEHSEYRPENDPGDKKWSALLSEFGLYKLPSDPRKMKDLLERAHRSVSPTGSVTPKDAAKMLASRKVNAASADKGSGGQSAPGVQVKSNKQKSHPDAARYLKGFSAEEIAEILS